ncbi:hypothetical protein ACVME5_008156 [Bradyrhizobium liaoningense]
MMRRTCRAVAKPSCFATEQGSMGLGNHDLSCAYFSKTSRSYSSRTALRETCPFRSLAIFRRSGSVGALDVRLNLAKNRVGADDVLPNSRSNHSMVSSRTDRRLRHYHREFRGQKDSVTALCEERHRKWISIPTILTRRAKHPPPLAKSRQPLFAKIFHFTEIRFCGILPPSRSRERGDRTSSRTWAGVRWTRQRRAREGGIRAR